MAARGTESKSKLFAKLMEIYPDAFFEDEGKILRVPMDENGDRVEIKVTLTAAKTNLRDGNAASAFSAEAPVQSAFPAMPAPTFAQENDLEPTEEEKQRVQLLLNSLGL